MGGGGVGRVSVNVDPGPQKQEDVSTVPTRYCVGSRTGGRGVKRKRAVVVEGVCVYGGSSRTVETVNNRHTSESKRVNLSPRLVKFCLIKLKTFGNCPLWTGSREQVPTFSPPYSLRTRNVTSSLHPRRRMIDLLEVVQ